MEYRLLGNSGFKVPVLGFGAGTFGGVGPLFQPGAPIGARNEEQLKQNLGAVGWTLSPEHMPVLGAHAAGGERLRGIT
jgi:aryl-alcohol dehydrogenase-like predicted oxidoreductase